MDIVISDRGLKWLALPCPDTFPQKKNCLSLFQLPTSPPRNQIQLIQMFFPLSLWDLIKNSAVDSE
jgi:hypothetical protein